MVILYALTKILYGHHGYTNFTLKQHLLNGVDELCGCWIRISEVTHGVVEGANKAICVRCTDHVDDHCN